MKYKTCVNVHHNGDKYPPGSLIELSGKDADELLKCGAIEPLNKPFSAKSINVSVKLDTGGDNV